MAKLTLNAIFTDIIKNASTRAGTYKAPDGKDIPCTKLSNCLTEIGLFLNRSLEAGFTSAEIGSFGKTHCGHGEFFGYNLLFQAMESGQKPTTLSKKEERIQKIMAEFKCTREKAEKLLS